VEGIHTKCGGGRLKFSSFYSGKSQIWKKLIYSTPHTLPSRDHYIHTYIQQNNNNSKQQQD
jgi:hypothetical protein